MPIRPRLCAPNWIKTYLEFVKRHESPESFHFWVALTTLSAAVDRRAFVFEAYKEIYPNLYTVLVAPSGACKKGGAIEIGVGLSQDARAARFFANQTTRQGLVRELYTNSLDKDGNPTNLASTYIVAPEWSTFVGRDAVKSGLVGVLTDLFDCPKYWRYATKESGNFPLHKVSLQMLGATTPQIMQESVPRELVGGGFTSRVCFVYEENAPRKPPVRELTPEEKKARFQLVYDLMTIKQLRGQFRWTEEAQEYYDHWYLTDETHKTLDAHFGGYVERKPHLILRVAMLHSLAEDNLLILAKPNIEFGMAMFNLMEAHLGNTFSFLETEEAKKRQLIVDKLKQCGGRLSHSELQRKLHRRMKSLDEFKRFLDELIEVEAIQVQITGKATYYAIPEMP